MLKIGEFARLGQVSIKTLRHYAVLDRWLPTSGYQIAGPCREIYHRSPLHTSDPTSYVTEIHYPIVATHCASHSSQSQEQEYSL